MPSMVIKIKELKAPAGTTFKGDQDQDQRLLSSFYSGPAAASLKDRQIVERETSIFDVDDRCMAVTDMIFHINKLF